jgi:hypothetical protein
MSGEPLFKGLIVDEYDHPVDITRIGEESFLIVDDDGFLRHIPSEQVDKQVLDSIRASIEGNEDLISEQTSKIMGQDDIFSRAIISNQLKNLDKQFEMMLQTGIPEEGRAYMGMMGFKVVINIHGEVVKVIQPSAPSDEGE